MLVTVAENVVAVPATAEVGVMPETVRSGEVETTVCVLLSRNTHVFALKLKPYSLMV